MRNIARVSIFDLRTSRDGQDVRIAFTGELDLASAGRVEEELAAIERDAPARIVLDLRGLTFMDSTGLRLVAGADARAREAGRRVTIIQGPEAVRRVFEITRLDERLDIVADDSSLASEAG